MLANALPEGAQELVVDSEAGFVVGDTLFISSSVHFETRTIASFGSIVLDAPLAYAYPAGSTVLKQASALSGDGSARAASTILVVGLIGGVVGAALFLCICRAYCIWCSRWCRKRRLRGSKVEVFPAWVEVFPAWDEAQGVVPAGCAQGAPAAAEVVEFGMTPGDVVGIQWVAQQWPSSYAVGRR